MGRRERRSRDESGFVHRFEGPEVLAELGLDAARIARLRAAGVL